MSNPQIDEDKVYCFPAVETFTDPEDGRRYDRARIPTEVRAKVGPQGRPVSLPLFSTVTIPTEEETRQLIKDKPCVHCIHFDQKSGRKELERNQTIGRIIHEHHWDTGLLGMHPEDYGICAMNPEQMTSPVSTCDHWKARAGGFKFYCESQESIRARAKSTVKRTLDWLTRPNKGL